MHSKGGMSCIPGEGVEPGSSHLLDPRMVAAGCKIGGSQLRWREKLGLLRERWVGELYLHLAGRQVFAACCSIEVAKFARQVTLRDHA